jgi:hypothetical protein
LKRDAGRVAGWSIPSHDTPAASASEDQAPSPIQPKDLLAKFGFTAEKVLAAAKGRLGHFKGKPV